MMMPVSLMHVPVLQFFRGRLTQPDDLHIEMKLITRQRMVEIERHVIPLNRFDACVARLTGIIPDG
jgi:hypothetical protein